MSHTKAMENKKTGEAKYLTEIDSLRAIAIILVLTYHINKEIIPNGYTGVDVFFVVSGFVISLTLYKKNYTGFKSFVSEFYARRLKRLYPVLMIFITITAIFTYAFDPDINENFRMSISALFGVSNIYIYIQQTDYFSVAQELNPWLHTWSLGVEFQFYLIFPVITWITGYTRENTKNGEKNLETTLIVIGTISSLIYYYQYYTDFAAAYFLSVSRIWEICIGCLTLIAVKKRNNAIITLSNIPTIIFFAMIVLAATQRNANGLIITPVICLLTACALVTIHEKQENISALKNPIVHYIGKISYPLYLWHYGILSISRMTVGIHWWTIPIQLTTIMILSIASYELIEKRIDRYISDRQRFKLINTWLVACTATATTLFIFYKNSILFYQGKDKEDNYKNSYIWSKNDCEIGFQNNKRVPKFDNCWIKENYISKPGTNKYKDISVYSFGNSYNTQLVHALGGLVSDKNMNVKVNAFSCSGITSQSIHRIGNSKHPCRVYIKQYIKWMINRIEEDDIVIMNTSMSFLARKNILIEEETKQIVSSNKAMKIFANELNILSKILTDKKAKLYISSGIPYLVADPKTCGNWYNKYNSKYCNTINKGSEKDQLATFNALKIKLNNQIKEINTYETMEKELMARVNLYKYFMKKDHISKSGSILLLPLFKEQIETIVQEVDKL